MKRKSFAKLNLTLDVIKKREDGYHELDMIMVPIDLFDTVDIVISDKMEMSTNKGFLPLDDRNTIIKAINILREKYKFSENFKIKLMKNTPTQGGMGGGSSNAATAIKMINEMLNLNMSEAEMLDVASKVGADVSFTLYGKPAAVKGFGEKLKPINFNLDFHIFIIKPKAGISTPKAFSRLDLNNLNHYDTDKVIRAIEENDYDMFIESIGNSLEEGAALEVSEILQAKNDLLEFGFDAAIMSGSGSSVFGITKDEQLARAAVVNFFDKYAFVKKSRVIKDVMDEEFIN